MYPTNLLEMRLFFICLHIVVVHIHENKASLDGQHYDCIHIENNRASLTGWISVNTPLAASNSKVPVPPPVTGWEEV